MNSNLQQIPDEVNLTELDTSLVSENVDTDEKHSLPKPPTAQLHQSMTLESIIETVLMDLKWKMSMEKHILQEQERYWLAFSVSIPKEIQIAILKAVHNVGSSAVWTSDREIQIELLGLDELLEVQERKKIEKEKYDKELKEFLEQQKLNPRSISPEQSKKHEDRKREVKNWKKPFEHKIQENSKPKSDIPGADESWQKVEKKSRDSSSSKSSVVHGEKSRKSSVSQRDDEKISNSGTRKHHSQNRSARGRGSSSSKMLIQGR